MGIGGMRHQVIAQGFRPLPGDQIPDHSPHGLGCMGKQHLPGHISDGIDPGNRRPAHLIGFDPAAGSHRHTGFVQTQFRCVGAEPHHDHHLIRLDSAFRLALFEVHDNAIRCFIDTAQRRSGLDLDPLFFEGTLQLRACLRIFIRQQVRLHFHDGHSSTIAIPDRGEFHTDGTAADDHDPARQCFLQDRLTVIQDLFTVRLHSGNLHRLRPAGNDDIFRTEVLRCAVIHEHVQAVGIRESCSAEKHIHTGIFQQEGHALVQPLRDLAGTLYRGSVIQTQVFAGNAEGFAVFAQRPGQFRVLQQGFGGNAAHIQAHAAEAFPFDHRCFQSVLCGLQCRRISTGPRPDHDHIIFFHYYLNYFLAFLCSIAFCNIDEICSSDNSGQSSSTTSAFKAKSSILFTTSLLNTASGVSVYFSIVSGSKCSSRTNLPSDARIYATPSL